MVLVSLFNGSSGSSSKEELPTRPKPERSAMLTPAIQLHPLTSEDGLLVKIQPPRGPKDSQLNHVPCDLVLSIDVSGSMGASAPIPARPAEKQEEFGLSVLDLVKHAARTIMETLDSRDRLGIVTFSSRATVLQELTRMTASNKANTLEKIEGMRPLDLTNLWHGIRDGLGLFNTGEEDRGGRVPALLVLTDGMPNYMCPPRGYIPKLRAMEPLPATIHTFGFGYQLRSGLLKSIAEVGGGNYSFIPDAGMIVLANTDTPPIINVLLEYQHFTPTIHRAVAHKSALDVSSPLDPAEIAYHVSRSSLISFLSILCPLNAEFEHEPWLTLPDDLPEYLRELAATLPAADEKFATSHAGCRSLMLDLCGSPTAAAAGAPPASWTGQIALALTNRDHYARWGMHYLPSLAGAHARQVCNSFKDPGPLLYATDSPLFLTCRDRLDAAFDTLPAPAPSIPPPGKGDGAAAGGSPPAPAAPVSMWRYRDMDGTCFAGCAREVRIGRLRNGMWALTPKGPRKVAAVLRTGVASQAMCLVGSGGLLVTPWHPVSMHPSGEWVYPKEVAKRSIRYTGSMYSILLERHEDADAHAILVNGVWGVTLGHGLIAGDKTMEIRVHGFLGNYDKIRRALGTLPKRSGGVVLGGGVTRDRETGLINGFRRPEMRYVKALPTGQMKVVVYD
ncbi:Inter-alpha-trypsin inhibitor heavy chain H3 [Madurella mycetomatis]|uniref:Inter-alpha-trypsin inhibitor heavy chain H3 n=1 Tax=Madurella mycetomatis TaxID=100816 RepID=A0A175WGZ8_9PEZI|nr:Inter-alpha-trypsin inhibitor heavy chain H3 [Madurella mycetomatis]